MKPNSWFEWNIVSCEYSDGCTLWFDKFAGMRNYLACVDHDIANRTRRYPGKGLITRQRDMDVYFLGDLIDLAWEDCTKSYLLLVPHLLSLILFNVIPVFLAVRLTHRFWYKNKS